MKTCSKCKILKNDNDFYKNNYRCKQCYSEYYLKNKNSIQIVKRKWREKNSEYLSNKFKEYRKIHRLKLNQQVKKWAKNNLDKKRIHDNRRQKKNSLINKEIINQLKSKPCKDCNKIFPSQCMHFDHLKDKKYNIGNIISHSTLKLNAEISKCEVVCGNCHANRTINRIGIGNYYKLSINGKFIRDYKTQNNTCIDCKKQYNYWQLQFDHVPERGKKIFNISVYFGKSLDEVKIEIAKCDLVCTNCHLIRTYILRK